MSNPLVTKSFASQCLDFPRKVEQALSLIDKVHDAKDLLDQGVTMQTYAQQLSVAVDIERPIAIGVLKIKAKLGELMPPGKGGRGIENPTSDLMGLSKPTIAAYRKLAEHGSKLDEYYESTDDVPSQSDFIRWTAHGVQDTFTGEVEWYTPAEWISRAIAVMGSIDLDPASSESAQNIIDAGKYFNKDDDGLEQEWRGNIWLNPPYRTPDGSNFANKLCDEVESGNVAQAILLVNSSTDTAWFHRCGYVSSSIAFTLGRISFISDGETKTANSTGQTFFYFGKRLAKFRKVFEAAQCLVR